MERVKLLSVCDVYQPHTIATKDFVPDGKYIVYGANGAIGRYSEYNHTEPEVLMACRGATCGAINISKPFSWINGNAMVVKPNGSVPLSKKYLQYYLMSANKDDVISGTAQPQITRQNLAYFEVPVCGVSEQERIVTRIEELFSELDNAVETLQKTKQQLEVYRQAVIKEAFDSAQANNSSKTIKDVCYDIKVGIVIKPTQYYVETGGIPSFRNANVRRNYIEDANWVQISNDGHKANQRSEVHSGDVLIARSGVNLGMAAAVPAKYDGYNAIDVVIAVPKQDVVLPEYLAYYTNSPYGREIVKQNQRGAAQGHLNVTAYGKLPIYVPEIEVQKRMISEIEAKTSVCDSIEKAVDTAVQQSEAMRQSILKQAFEGSSF